MNDKVRIKMMGEGMEIFESLLYSTSKAGGTGFTVELLSEITALDLLSRLATNNIRFYYTKSKKEKEHE